MWDSFAVVDELIDPKHEKEMAFNTEQQPQHDKSVIITGVEDASPGNFDILQHLMTSKEQRKQHLISKHHDLGEKLNKHIYESPLHHKSRPIDQPLKVPSPVKSVDTVSTLKRFDSKFDDWHINEQEIQPTPYKELIPLQSLNPFTQQSVEIAVQTSALNAIPQTTQTHSIVKDVGIQTDLDYFDPLLSFSKQSIEKELRKELLYIQRNTPTKQEHLDAVFMTNTPMKPIPRYKQILMDRFLEDVRILMNNNDD